MIKVQDLSKNYGDVQAVKSINFEIDDGEIVGFLGENGAGKTTTLKMLTGYLVPTKGNVEINDLNINDSALEIQKQIGYLPELNPLYPEMYVKEYFHFVSSLYRIKDPPIDRLMEQTGLLEYQRKKIQTLSKGYKQRVGLVAALLHDPQLVILDEPTTGLDPNQLLEIRKLIRELGEKKTVILSTHILQEVDAICDRVLIINKGEIIYDDHLENINKNQKQILEVSFDYRIEIEALSKIKNVEKVINTRNFNYEIHTKGTKDLRPLVFDFAYENGLKILNLQLKNQNLEQLFNNLTS